MEKFIAQLGEETFGEFYEAISGEVLDGELIKKASDVDLETLKKRGAQEKVPLEECWGGRWEGTRGSEVGRRE